jgi:uncharacterized protein (TIGR00730 family)
LLAQNSFMKSLSVAVFCGSRNGADPIYVQHAAELGKMLADRNIRLVYGGGNKGLMGAVANAVMEHAGHVIGVIPKMLTEWEHQHQGITDLRVVDDMHVRKRMMYELCDVAIILPGGNGTMDELFEMLTWNTLNIHNKKIILLNSGGYYDHLIAHIDLMDRQGFLYNNWRERLIICNDPAASIAVLV